MNPSAPAQRIPEPPCAVPGAPSPFTATGRTLRWGVVATGGIATSVTQDLARLEDGVLHAVSSRSQGSAEAFAEKFGFATSYHDDDGVTGYQRLFNDPEVDVVYIATPHAQHYEVAKAALIAGKHVLCEKAFTVNAREAAELIDLARANHLFLMEALWTRFLPSVNRAWDIIHSGELGEIQWVQADLGFPSDHGSSHRLWDPAAGGGALLDLGVYPLTWALGSLGFPAAVTATAVLNDDGVDTQNGLTLTYAGGAQAQLTTSLVAACPGQATVVGTKGWLRSGAVLHNPRELTVQLHQGEQRVETFEQAGGGYAYELRETTRCIQEGLTESPTMPWADTLDTMRLLDGVRGQLGMRYANDD
ncbi:MULTISPECIES: Gfo/Idh/MocA family protein [unclassified Arthrobacter]|uniref:Gfo/Idh/MocA family protein n=1 Tax=unclassified Arthrobacter TaxID=235627 RepID=UPI001490F7BC|nr:MULTISPECIES: Gfo/Idh/MocA family oxidoreductase [unclassified Arthrobacter]MBE0008947.1 gfo/Idh/MocA family oxidoreductase [Arthrobacter sp. AET 35A]NOJ62924.1 Gfo/Idh/MocA family oxidoreductase [Arthrobacter sp. 147(2020)]